MCIFGVRAITYSFAKAYAQFYWVTLNEKTFCTLWATMETMRRANVQGSRPNGTRAYSLSSTFEQRITTTTPEKYSAK